MKYDIATFIETGKQFHKKYEQGDPFPHIVMDGLFDPEILTEVLSEFNTSGSSSIAYQNVNESKFATKGEYPLGEQTKALVHFLNSQPVLDFLTELTGIQGLVPDPYLWGGGLHEIKPGGYLKIHADFNNLIALMS